MDRLAAQPPYVECPSVQLDNSFGSYRTQERDRGSQIIEADSGRSWTELNHPTNQAIRKRQFATGGVNLSCGGKSSTIDQPIALRFAMADGAEADDGYSEGGLADQA